MFYVVDAVLTRICQCSHKEEGLEKLKVELTDSRTKMESLSKTFNCTKDSAETERLQQTINELKSRLEQLEVKSFAHCSSSVIDTYPCLDRET